MSTMQSTVVVAVFPTQDQAQQALDELRRAGFSDGEIGFLRRAAPGLSGSEVVPVAAGGAVEGGLVGGIVGAAVALLIPGFGPALAGGIIAATLSGAALGATAGGLMAALSELGVSNADARFYQQELSAGHIIITVKAASGQEEARTLLKRAGSTSVKTHVGVMNATLM
ncbi:MAG: hypothetical protein NVSMB44_28770 [Ktedonobacteraceae bacterium]